MFAIRFFYLFGLLILSQSAWGYSVEVSPNYKLILDEKKWEFGQGQLTVDGPTWNIYSNKTNKESQIFYEDIFIPVKFANDRLPKECLSILSKKNKSEDYCYLKNNSKKNELNQKSMISIFKTSDQKIVKVRTIVLMGKTDESNEILRSSLKRNKTKGVK